MSTQRSVVWITANAVLLALEQYLELFISAQIQKFYEGDQTRPSLLERQAEWCVNFVVKLFSKKLGPFEKEKITSLVGEHCDVVAE